MTMLVVMALTKPCQEYTPCEVRSEICLQLPAPHAQGDGSIALGAAGASKGMKTSSAAGELSTNRAAACFLLEKKAAA